ncbi:hypothetical protein [Paenibacillus antarcticus]|uniref:Sporulation membrane protein YtrI C-terminal domain-containing protein n=1 Tax=Paenibacillus antarcticus TaxID=253703 RepID=A0A168LUU5_9BACL|nr:hypothetical protein [Paenibacillus antarcticus]OAB43867.1 hypothetical protein PBAT_16715 [Paenibacillus antarcticus]
MRIPSITRILAFSKTTSLIVLGMVLGSIVYNAIFHASYNQLWQENQDLKIQKNQFEDDIKTLKKYSKQQTVIKEIKLRAEQQDPPLDSIIVKEILVQVGDDLEVLRGRSVYEIDTDSKIARTLLDRKIYTVREKNYAIQIKTMLVSESVLQIWISIKNPPVR